MPLMTTRRNIYAERLLEFPDLAFGGDRVFDHGGRWRTLFGRRIGAGFDGRIIFEIGCSDAETLCRIAARFPHTGFVGLDWKYKSLYLGAARVAKLGLRNVVLLRGRAQDVSKIFAAGDVDEIWVFHPDPCDRPVELKNRLIAEPFLADAHTVLRGCGSAICLKTDHPGYYQWTLGLFGLPEPAWFQPTREARNSGGPATPSPPRVKARELVRPEDIPRANEAILSRFAVSMNSPDYWSDPATLAHTSDRCFAGEATLFESRFLKKRLPIYYFEMTKRAPE